MTTEISHYSGQSCLFVVATPIGNLQDFCPRAVKVLTGVDLIAAEDTRHSAKLLQACSINTPLISFHDFSGPGKLIKLVEKLVEGKSIALISDAGTPAISDPGYELVRAARQKGIAVTPVPGPSALLAALSISGLASDRFIFEGFLASKPNARKQRLDDLKLESRSMIFFESPRRIVPLLEDIVGILGSQREVFVARELTKRYETSWLDTAENSLARVISEPDKQKGEFVIVVAGRTKSELQQEKLQEGMRVMKILLSELSLKQATKLAALISGAAKNQLYDAALELQHAGSEEKG